MTPVTHWMSKRSIEAAAAQAEQHVAYHYGRGDAAACANARRWLELLLAEHARRR